MLAIAAAMGASNSYVVVLPGIVVLSLGQAIGWTAMFAAAGTGVAPEQQGIASAVAATTQQVGAAVLALLGVALAFSFARSQRRQERAAQPTPVG